MAAAATVPIELSPPSKTVADIVGFVVDRVDLVDRDTRRGDGLPAGARVVRDVRTRSRVFDHQSVPFSPHWAFAANPGEIVAGTALIRTPATARLDIQLAGLRGRSREQGHE